MSQQVEMTIPNTKEIKLYIHCSLCASELPEGMSPAQWQDIEVGWTDIGFQVWCRRHDCNIMHVDFEGKQHLANTCRAAES